MAGNQHGLWNSRRVSMNVLWDRVKAGRNTFLIPGYNIMFYQSVPDSQKLLLCHIFVYLMLSIQYMQTLQKSMNVCVKKDACSSLILVEESLCLCSLASVQGDVFRPLMTKFVQHLFKWIFRAVSCPSYAFIHLTEVSGSIHSHSLTMFSFFRVHAAPTYFALIYRVYAFRV